MDGKRLLALFFIVTCSLGILGHATLSYGESDEPICKEVVDPEIAPVDCPLACDCSCGGVSTHAGTTVTGEKYVTCKTYSKACSTRWKGPVGISSQPVSVPFQPFKSGDPFYQTQATCNQGSDAACCCTRCADDGYSMVNTYDEWGVFTGQTQVCNKYIWEDTGDGYVYTYTNNWKGYTLPSNKLYPGNQCTYYEDLPDPGNVISCKYAEAYFKTRCVEWGDPVLGPFGPCTEKPSDPCPDCSQHGCSPPLPSCGNGVCNPIENCSTCPSDCGPCASTCPGVLTINDATSYTDVTGTMILPQCGSACTQCGNLACWEVVSPGPPAMYKIYDKVSCQSPPLP